MPVFYTNFSIPDKFQGITRGPFVFIRPECKSDVGLREHEKTHAKQWIRTLGLHSILYIFSKRYRLTAEVEAYRKQLAYSPNDVALFAGYLSSNYGLNISKAEAEQLLA